MQNRIRWSVIAGHGGVVSRFLIRVLRAIGLIRDSDKCFMSPLWGFKAFGVSCFYKHAAPLGLNEQINRLSFRAAT